MRDADLVGVGGCVSTATKKSEHVGETTPLFPFRKVEIKHVNFRHLSQNTPSILLFPNSPQNHPLPLSNNHGFMLAQAIRYIYNFVWTFFSSFFSVTN